jgi:hypothetical protein
MQRRDKSLDEVEQKILTEHFEESKIDRIWEKD